MNATSWIFRRLTQNEFKAITDQIQSEGGGSQTYIDLPKGKISDDNLTSFFGEGTSLDKGYKWEVSIHSLSLDMQPQEITISQRRDSSNCIREQNKDKRINIWKSEYSGFPNDSYNESENPIYIFVLKSDDDNFYAGWFYAKSYEDKWFLTMDLCKPFIGEPCGYAVFDTPITIDINDFHWPFRSLSGNLINTQNKLINKTRQEIYFGAPGVGKSHHLKSVYKTEDDVIRITFHPETDYASFVGCYKPQSEGKEIVYKFQGQAFTEAYVKAWRRYVGNDEPIDTFLVIEEINRGNCAQIFGDIFQLLDRNEQGFSDYSVIPDKDLQEYLNAQLADIATELEKINKGVAQGTSMILPPNLHIIATMNTSDQSLFPIDSAFKRRWDWIYMPIDTVPKNKDGKPFLREIHTSQFSYDWGSFLEKINERIYSTTLSEDKQLGFWFVKPKGKDGIISASEFVSKVVFFLWNDIYKDYVDDSTSIFLFSENGNPESNDKSRHSFRDFTPKFQHVNHSLIDSFLTNLGVKRESIKAIDENKNETPVENESTNLETEE